VNGRVLNEERVMKVSIGWLFALPAIALGLCVAGECPAQSLRSEIESVVKDYLASHPDEVGEIAKDYLVKHPEAFQEVVAGMLKKRPGTAPAKSNANTDKSALVKSNAAAIFNSEHQVTLGNPQGDVTLVEFFDYNCGFCKRALPDMVDLIKADPKLKVVLKEFPILGPASLEAARVAIAVRMQDASGQKYLDFHQKLLGRGQADKARALAIAQELGLDMTRLERDVASEEVDKSLAESRGLAQALGLTGTPSYVVGDNVVVGAVGIAALSEKVRVARQ